MSDASTFDSSILPVDASPQRGRKSNADADNIFHLLRVTNGFSTKELARLAGSSPMTINRLEHGCPAHFRVIRSLSELYGITMDDLIRNNTAAAAVTIGKFTSQQGQRRKMMSNERIDIGDIGEEIVAQIERDRLAGTGYENRVSTQPAKNRRNGYDVISATLDGEPKFIEVKTTRSDDPDEPFYMSAGELRTAERLHKEDANYELIRVYALDMTAGTYRYAVYSVEDVLTIFDAIPCQYLMKKRGKSA